MPDAPPAHPPTVPGPARDWLSRIFGSGGLGVGLVLVVVPATALMLGLSLRWFDGMRLVGLPLLAIFGIIILFGTLALVAMLFQSLELTDRQEALALPPGSIRAAIALSLIVLFAIISIMLFQSMLGSSILMSGMTAPQRDELVARPGSRVIEVQAGPCAAPVPAGGACPDDSRRFDVRLQGAEPPAGANDLAKQLLVLVGTLMTSVTSFYFASRSQTEIERRKAPGEPEKPAGAPPRGAPSPAAGDQARLDGSAVAITGPPSDGDGPPARGGVGPAPSGTGG